jgi:hypothetical protein
MYLNIKFVVSALLPLHRVSQPYSFQFLDGIKKVGHDFSRSRVLIQAYNPETCNEATADR